MIDIPKKLVEEAKNTNDYKEIEQYVLSNYTMGDIIRAFAEIYVAADEAVNRPQIAVTQAEYEQIMGLFRVKGQRIMNGEVVSETRGRKPKNWAMKSERSTYNDKIEE